MNKRFRTLSMSGLLVAGLALSGAAAYAQQDNSTAQQPMQGTTGEHGGHGDHGHMDPDQRLAHMTQRYNLSADQQSQIKPILVDEQQQMQALHADNSSSRQDRMTKMQSIHQDAATKISAILNPDQKQKFQQDQARMQQRMQDKTGTRGNDAESGATRSGNAPQPQ